MPNRAYDWKMTIDGAGLCDRAKLHVGSITYEESLTEAAELEFTISHSDSFRFDNTHISPNKGYKFADLGLGCKVQFWLGFVHDLRLLFTGEVIEMKPEFTDGDDASHLSIRCHDLSYRLKRERIREYTNPSYLSIAREIAEDHGLTLIAKPEWPLADYKLKDDQDVQQTDQTDWQVLQELAKAHAYSLLVRNEYLVMADDDYLAGTEWYSLLDKDHPLPDLTMTYNVDRPELEAPGARPLISFRPGIETAGQRKKVEVINWTGYGDIGETTGKAQLEEGRDEVYTDIRVRTERIETIRIYGVKLMASDSSANAQARQMAQAEMERRARQLVRGEGVLGNGEPGMRAGQRHTIRVNDMRPFGAKYSGRYVIEAVRHELNSEGACATSFDVRRDGLTKGQ